MGGTRRRWWIVVATVAVVVATGCGRDRGAGDEAGVTRPKVEKFSTHGTPITTATTTTPVSDAGVTHTTVARPRVPGTTVAPPAADTTDERPPVADVVVVREPVYVNGIPQVTATPSRATAGNRVELDGVGFTDETWGPGNGAGNNLWLSVAPGQPACYLVAAADNDVQVDEIGHLTGGFTVPPTGVCRFTATEEMSTAGLEFQIAYRCTPCFIGTFGVVQPSIPAPGFTGDCGVLAFSHGPVESGEIHVDGISCAEARPVLDGAWAWAPVTGPEHVDAAGFSCNRIDQTLDPPRATYRCTRGSQSIWFVSTGRS